MFTRMIIVLSRRRKRRKQNAFGKMNVRRRMQEEGKMIEADHRYLRYALMVAQRSREHGDRPFGAVLVSSRGRVLLEAENTQDVTHDCTSHAETRLLAEASRRFTRHCARPVHALCQRGTLSDVCRSDILERRWPSCLRTQQLPADEVIGNRSEQLREHCAEVLARGTHPVEVVGPMFEEEAAQVFNEGTWNARGIAP